MGPKDDIRAVKDAISADLLAIEGVNGVGIGTGVLNVYLAQENQAVREQVDAIVKSRAAGTAVRYLVSGEFKAQ